MTQAKIQKPGWFSRQWSVENVEALLEAVILALVVRFFLMEAYQIPTGSMEPTLHGNLTLPEGTRGHNGDRLLVNKLAYVVGEPRRFDVIVFKYPLNSDKNFIKRLVGLPGETLEIKRGDIWINGKLARKPPLAQQAMWRTLHPLGLPEDQREAWKIVSGDWLLEQGKMTVQSVSGPEGAMVQFRDDLYQGCADVKWQGKVTLGEAASTWAAVIQKDALEIVAQVHPPVGGTAAVSLLVKNLQQQRRVVAQKKTGWSDISVGQALALSFSHADCHVELSLPGKPALILDYDEACWEEGSYPTASVRTGFFEGKGELSSVTLLRDVYYIPPMNWEHEGKSSYKIDIPEDGYFVLGDNCTNSKDSRYWSTTTINLNNGEAISGDRDNEMASLSMNSAGRIPFMDCMGRTHWVSQEKELDRSYEDTPFIHRRQLVGRAFMIFWPAPRIRIIH